MNHYFEQLKQEREDLRYELRQRDGDISKYAGIDEGLADVFYWAKRQVVKRLIEIEGALQEEMWQYKVELLRQELVDKNK